MCFTKIQSNYVKTIKVNSLRPEKGVLKDELWF